MVALGLHDLSYVKSDKKIPSPGIFAGPGAYQPSVARKIAALEDYIKVAPYLPPKDPLTIAPVLWHDDLHAGNIFVHPDDSSQITCIIDWQSSYISPLFRHTVRPDFLEYEGPKPLLGLEGEARKAPELPANFKELSPEDQKEAEALKRQQSLYKLFELYSAVENLSAYRALRHQETLRCILIECAAITSYHSEPNVEARLIEAVDNWEKLVGPEGPPCPLHYSVEDRAAQAEDFTRWSACLGLKDLVLQRLEAPLDWDGAVGVDEYTAAREKLHTVREGFLDLMANNDEERVEWARAWPFRDDEDTSE